MTIDANTLGVLDWGVGGLGVVRALRQHGIRNSIVYLSDTGVAPYGRLTQSKLVLRVDQMVAELHALGARRVLIACNAASTVIDRLHARSSVSGVIEPALRTLQRVEAARIGVIGGARTIRSGLYRRGLARSGRAVLQRIAQPLSGHIESRTLYTTAGQRDVERILQPLRHVNVLVLACTHYPAIIDQLQPHVPHARLFDPATAVAVDLAAQLTTIDVRGDLRLLTTGDPQAMRAAASAAWGDDPGHCARFDV